MLLTLLYLEMKRLANTSGKKSGSSQTKKPSQSRNSSPAKKNPAPANQKTTAVASGNGQVTAIVLVAVALFMLAIVFIEGENVWTYMHNGMFGIFGISAYIIPILLIYMGVIYAKGKPLGGAALNVASAGGFVLFLSSVIHLFAYDSDIISDKSVPDQITEVWQNAIEQGGKADGVLGAIVGGLFGKLFGKTGALVTLILLAIVAVLLLTGITLPVLFSYIKKPVIAIGDEAGKRFEESAIRREEARAERERLLAEKAEQERIEQEKAEEEKKKKLPEQIEKKPKPGVFTSGGDVFVKEPGFDENYDSPLSEPEMPKIPLHSLPASLPGIPTLDGTPATAAAAALHSPLPGETVIASKAAEKAAEAVAEAVTEAVSEIRTEDEITEKKPEEKPIKKRIRRPSVDIQVEDKSESLPEVKRDYVLPSIDCLDLPAKTSFSNVEAEMLMGKNKLLETLDSFKIKASVTDIVRGPSVTRYELMPDAGVRISKITSLADDIALHLAAQSVRIEAPIPGKAAIGIEIPNDAKSMVSMREIIDTDTFRAGSQKSKLNVALGKDITGNVICADLTKMPHLLVAGTTGSGKSVCMNTMIISILYNASPDDVKLVMIDPKQVEFTIYNGIAHLDVPVVTDARKAAGALGWAVSEMEKRYRIFSENQVRDIKGYNKKANSSDELQKMHHIVIFIDELSDLMMVAPKEVEDSICRLAQMARAAGIHLVIATQSPRADIITGLIKANIPSRIALKVSNGMESRIIMDQGGAEKLLGNGDMLFLPVGTSKPVRIQGCYISDEEVETVVDHIKKYATASYNDETMKEIEAKAAAAANAGKKGGYDDEGDEDDPLDPMFNQAAEVVIQAGQASTTMLQKKLKLGYARASRVMDQLEDNGIVGPTQGAKPREILVSMQDWYERQALATSGIAKPRDDQMSFSDLSPVSAPVSEEYEEEYEEETEELEDDYEEAEEESGGFEDIYSDSSYDKVDDEENEPDEVDDFSDIYEDGEEDDTPPFDLDDETDEDDEPEEISIDIDEPDEVDDFSDIYDDEEEDDETDDEIEDEDDDNLDDDFIDRPISVDDIFADDNDSRGFDDLFD